jgi:hypothetical protein
VQVQVQVRVTSSWVPGWSSRTWVVVVVVDGSAVGGAWVVVVVGFGTVVVVVAAPAPTAPMTASDGPHAMTAAAANVTRFVKVNLRTIDTLSASVLPPSRRLYRPMARNREPQRRNFVQFSTGHASGPTRPESRLSF